MMLGTIERELPPLFSKKEKQLLVSHLLFQTFFWLFGRRQIGWTLSRSFRVTLLPLLAQGAFVWWALRRREIRIAVERLNLIQGGRIDEYIDINRLFGRIALGEIPPEEEMAAMEERARWVSQIRDLIGREKLDEACFGKVTAQELQVLYEEKRQAEVCARWKSYYTICFSKMSWLNQTVRLKLMAQCTLDADFNEIKAICDWLESWGQTYASNVNKISFTDLTGYKERLFELAKQL